jgi:dTDP-L-rhamnose 4-epimerase
LQNLPLIIYEDGRQTRDFVHIQDVVDANLLVLERESANFQAFNVGSGRATTVNDYASAVLKKLGSSLEPRTSGEYRRGDNRHSVSGIDKLSQLGWSPRRSLSVILDDFMEWIESVGGVPAEVPDAHADMRNAGVILTAVG